MIELALPCEVYGRRTAPFVVKASAPPPELGQGVTSAHYAPVAPNSANCTLASKYGAVVISGLTGAAAESDVFYIDPVSKRAHRWLRKSANQNTLLITERCDQLCIMCSQPPKKTHIDLFSYMLEACLLTERRSIIGFSGGEPTLFKEQLFDLIERCAAARPDLSFHVLTNAQHFTEKDVPRLRALAPYVCWGVPVYSATPATHDQIVGKSGAFTALGLGLSRLTRAGAIIELRTVVMQQTVQGLPALAKWTVTRVPGIDVWAVMQLERQGFARNRWHEQFFDHSESFGTIGNAVSYARAWGIPVALYNFPRCTVPEEFRPLAPATISDWKQSYFDECSTCSEKLLCGGLFAWHNNVPYQRWGAL